MYHEQCLNSLSKTLRILSKAAFRKDFGHCQTQCQALCQTRFHISAHVRHCVRPYQNVSTLLRLLRLSIRHTAKYCVSHSVRLCARRNIKQVRRSVKQLCYSFLPSVMFYFSLFYNIRILTSSTNNTKQ